MQRFSFSARSAGCCSGANLLDDRRPQKRMLCRVSPAVSPLHRLDAATEDWLRGAQRTMCVSARRRAGQHHERSMFPHSGRENLHQLVCKGEMRLADAQKCIESNWVECWEKYVVPRYGAE